MVRLDILSIICFWEVIDYVIDFQKRGSRKELIPLAMNWLFRLKYL